MCETKCKRCIELELHIAVALEQLEASEAPFYSAYQELKYASTM